MAIIKIPQSVFDADKPLPPGWYKAQIISITIAPNSKKDSMNTIPVFRLEESGREFKKWVNSKFPIDAPRIHAAATGVELEEEAEIDTDEWLNKKLQIFLEEQMYNGKIQNSITDYAPYEKDLTPPDWATDAAL